MVDFPINVVIDSARAARGARQVNQQLAGIENRASSLRTTLLNTFAVIGVAELTRRTVGLINTFGEYQNRLRQVTTGEEELRDVTSELFDVANRTRQSFTAISDVFTRTSLAVRELGLSQQETLQFTESLSQAVQISGATAAEAEGGLLQLSQGLASGALRGDELRSVLENLPVVADVISNSLGVTRGQLRELGADGRITAEVITRAFSEARGELDERFGRSIPTISQAFTVLQNRVIEFVGSLDEAIGISDIFITTITFIGDSISVLVGLVEGLLVALGPRLVRIVSGAATAAFLTLARTLRRALIPAIIALNIELRANPLGFVIRVLQIILPILVAFTDVIGDTVSAIIDWARESTAVQAVIGALAATVEFFGDVIDELASSLVQASRGAVLLADTAGLINVVTTALQEQREARLANIASLEASIEATREAVAVDSIRQEAIEDRTINQIESTLAIADTIVALTREREQLRLSTDERQAANAILKLENQARERGLELSTESRQALEREFRLTTRARRAEERRREGIQRSIRRRQELTQIIEQLRAAESPLIGVQTQLRQAQDDLNESVRRGLVSRQEANNLLAQLSERLNRGIDPLTQLRQETEILERAIENNNGEIERAIQLQSLLFQVQASGSPITLQAIDEINRLIDRNREAQRTVENLTQAQQALRDSLNPGARFQQFIGALSEGFNTASDALEEYATTLEQQDSRTNTFFDNFRSRFEVTSRDLATTLANSITSVTDELITALEGLLFDVETNFEDTFRSLGRQFLQLGVRSAIGFGLGLPAFQTGGAVRIPGTGAPDSRVFAAQVSPGETVRVTTPSQEAALQQAVAGGGASQSQPTPVNIFNLNSPDEQIDALNTPRGEEAILNIIRRNPQVTRRLLR